MKTRRNHRKTTNSRRRRVVKQQRGQTRIHYRKGTVSSGRRHKFFKRGGEPVIEPPIDPTIKMIVDDVENMVKTNFGSNLSLTVELVTYLDEKQFEKIPNKSVIFAIHSKKIQFRILQQAPGKQSVYIDLDDPTKMSVGIYGRIMVTIGTDNYGSYHPTFADAIFDAINLKPDLQQYKQKQ